ncbi:hypothetical protein ACH5RR_041030 [Cinchona calisaya]|uniref:CRC domain-containing protein n=1 Tax=Cinchona calisaya TaxID=153742 RepID=A0ABD2XTD9_9GENT
MQEEHHHFCHRTSSGVGVSDNAPSEFSECKPTTNDSISSPPSSSDLLEGQESPVFSYISNLSPIKPDKAAPIAQGFPGINSPPLVIRSPQININSQQTFLRRPQFPGSSDVGLSGQDENFEASVTVAEESGKSSSHLSSGLGICPDKTFVSKNSPPEKASCPQGSADDYWTEIVIMDGGDSSSENLTPKNPGDIFQSQTDLLDSKGSVDNSEEKYDNRKDEMNMETSPAILVQAEEPVEPNEKSGDGNMPPDICTKIEPKTSVDHAPDNHHGGHLKAEDAGSGHKFVGSTSQLESLQIAEECGSCRENARGPCTQAVENKMQDHSPKVHGISRRLQFEDAQSKIMANIAFGNSSGSAGYPRSPVSPSDSEVLESTSLKKPASRCNRLLENMTLPKFSPQNSGAYSVKAPKRSGIDLHLNTSVNSSMKSAERDTFDGQGKKSISIMSHHLHKNCSISSNVVEDVSVSSDDSRHDTHASIAASFATSLSPYGMKPFYEAVLKPIEFQAYPSHKRMSNSETSDNYEDFGQSSLKNKRKKTLDDGESYGCKHCNCKKTKCLKLYCDCFAAGIYCAEPCACEGCFNRPEYEDTVFETRQQIESRNALAFAPKIVQHIPEPPTNIFLGDGGHFTPSSKRHKRGCSCKKSKCLKKYCECYQADVGCSDGCRCEACENFYGQKGDYGKTKVLVSKSDSSGTLDSSFDMGLEMVASKDGLLQKELYNPHNMIPLTPSFQCSNHGKGGSKAWFSSGRHLPSPESAITSIAPYGMSLGQATNPDNHNMILETNREIMDLVSFNQDLGYANGHSVNQFSPRCDAPSNTGHLTALPNSQGCANNSSAQMFPGNCHVSSTSSLRWRSSPITTSTNFGESKLHEAVDFDGGPYRIMDDDIPEILKETPRPPNAVNVSSPNKKRVSLPHGRGTELGSSSSARNCRKLVFQGVPSFPPFTPCGVSRGDSSQNAKYSQNSSCSN